MLPPSSDSATGCKITAARAKRPRPRDSRPKEQSGCCRRRNLPACACWAADRSTNSLIQFSTSHSFEAHVIRRCVSQPGRGGRGIVEGNEPAIRRKSRSRCPQKPRWSQADSPRRWTPAATFPQPQRPDRRPCSHRRLRHIRSNPSTGGATDSTLAETSFADEDNRLEPPQSAARLKGPRKPAGPRLAEKPSKSDWISFIPCNNRSGSRPVERRVHVRPRTSVAADQDRQSH